VFTVETSVRTAMEAVYKLAKLDKDVIEVYPSRYDIRYVVECMKKNAGIRGEFTEDDLPPIDPSKLGEIRKVILAFLNTIPPYYRMYTGHDQTVPEKESVLNPKYPLDK
jgi:oleate hydratase